MKKLLMLVLLLVATFVLGGCEVTDTDRYDHQFIDIRAYWDWDSERELIERFYYFDPKTEAVSLVEERLEVVGTANEVSIEFHGNYSIKSKEGITLYQKTDLEWQNISEQGYWASKSQLPDDVLVRYGTLPVLSENYEIGDTVRIFYQDYQLVQHYMVVRADTNYYVNFGEIRQLYIGSEE